MAYCAGIHMKGILLVDKPPGMTSHDVVDWLRHASGIRRIGHTGTLDPAATGLLVLCLGQATRLAEYLTGLDKVYEGSMQMGIVTDSYDMEGKVLEENSVPEIKEDDLKAHFASLTGCIMQVPPMVSAVKIGGERLYKKARRGEVIDRPARQITVHSFNLLKIDSPYVHFNVKCGSGTYVRSLCHEIGQEYGCGATLATLRRIAIGKFSIENATELDSLKVPHDIERNLLSMNDALDFPQVVVGDEMKRLIKNGNTIPAKGIDLSSAEKYPMIQVKHESGELIAVAKIEMTLSSKQAEIRPKKVFCSTS